MVEEVQSVYTDLNNSNAKTIAHLDYETQKIRAGKATPSMLQSVMVEYSDELCPDCLKEEREFNQYLRENRRLD